MKLERNGNRGSSRGGADKQNGRRRGRRARRSEGAADRGVHEDADLRSSTREWRKLRSHAIVACCLNSANNFAPFVCRLSTRSARSASRPRAREIAPGSTWTTSRAPINARRTLSLKRSNNGRRCIDGFSSIFSHGRWQPRSTPGSRCARRSTLVTAVRQLIYSM